VQEQTQEKCTKWFQINKCKNSQKQQDPSMLLLGNMYTSCHYQKPPFLLCFAHQNSVADFHNLFQESQFGINPYSAFNI